MSTQANRLFLVPLRDGIAVEAVYYGSGTLCISSQAGCAIGCPFCASGADGFKRNLTAEELAAQVTFAEQAGITPERITISGIGEPLHNLDSVETFITSSPLPVSVTTTGGTPERLERLLHLSHNGIMLSLHAGTPETHAQLIPNTTGFTRIIAALQNNLAQLSIRKQRKIGINYLLLAGINDSGAEITAFIHLMQSMPHLTVHLLACNPVDGSTFATPAKKQYDTVWQTLKDAGLHVRRANQWRQHAEGGCGTLYLKNLAEK